MATLTKMESMEILIWRREMYFDCNAYEKMKMPRLLQLEVEIGLPTSILAHVEFTGHIVVW